MLEDQLIYIAVLIKETIENAKKELPKVEEAQEQKVSKILQIKIF